MVSKFQCQTFVRRYCSQFIKPGEFNCMLTTFDLFDMQIAEAIEENPEDYQKYIQSYFQAAILFALIWGVAIDTIVREERSSMFCNSIRTTL